MNVYDRDERGPYGAGRECSCAVLFCIAMALGGDTTYGLFAQSHSHGIRGIFPGMVATGMLINETDFWECCGSLPGGYIPLSGL